MTKLDGVAGSLLRKPTGEAEHEIARTTSEYKTLHTFKLDKEKPYQQQFADMYFLRLTSIKPAVDEKASEAWRDPIIKNEPAKKVERVLDIRQGELCWVSGTVYMEMALKPNILEDVSKDRWISAPKSNNRYYADDGSDAVTLEDESGRIRLTGDILKNVVLVTGCVIAAMGTENVNGELEVIDLKFPDLPPQPERWAVAKTPATNGRAHLNKPKEEDQEMADAEPNRKGGKIAIVSGLEFGSLDASHAIELDLLLEYLLGEALEPTAQRELSHISRLIIAGNSIAPEDQRAVAEEEPTTIDKKVDQQKKYGYDSSAYNAVPSQLLDEFLSTLLPTIPITLLPGEHDPANLSFPQQPIHPAMFPLSRAYTVAPGSLDSGWLDTVTNPWEGEVDGWRVLGTSGQNVDDIFKYVGSNDRLGMMEAMCRWRCCAPTAPDTLWSYPFQDDDPFVMHTCPHLYFVGNQPGFGTKEIQGDDGQRVRLVAVPLFSATKEIVIVDTETLDVSKVKITAD
ncbi:DNA polymerase alpha/epsilon subunit B-domain-containing protein [Astrocystis sublimbata]|nr:DNA polymerase alpha/epsilon subunit B-domain-containing protein [Astrocystis sublimbata]